MAIFIVAMKILWQCRTLEEKLNQELDCTKYGVDSKRIFNDRNGY